MKHYFCNPTCKNGLLREELSCSVCVLGIYETLYSAPQSPNESIWISFRSERQLDLLVVLTCLVWSNIQLVFLPVNNNNIIMFCLMNQKCTVCGERNGHHFKTFVYNVL